MLYKVQLNVEPFLYHDTDYNNAWNVSWDLWQAELLNKEELLTIRNLEQPDDMLALRLLIESRGYNAISYVNNVEDSGKVSYIVWNDKYIKPINVIEIVVPPVSKAMLARSKQ
jgi:hypothetical protein